MSELVNLPGNETVHHSCTGRNNFSLLASLNLNRGLMKEVRENVNMNDSFDEALQIFRF